MVLPGAESYKPKGKDGGGDPKRALRTAFAKTGRLTQFIEPEDSKDSPEIRARVAVRDLMRQLGFVPEPARNSRGIDISIPAIGLKVYNSGNGKARASFPYCVRQDMRSGAVTVYCPSYLTEAYRTGAPHRVRPAERFRGLSGLLQAGRMEWP